MASIFVRVWILILLSGIAACGALPSTPEQYNGPILVLEVDSTAVRDSSLRAFANRMADTLQTQHVAPVGKGVRDDAAVVTLANVEDRERAYDALVQWLRGIDDATIWTITAAGNTIEGRLSEEHLSRLLRQTAEVSADIISRRISPSAPAAVPTNVEGGGQFTIQGPSNVNAQHIGAIATTPGNLTFHLVNDGVDRHERIPAGHVLAQPHPIGAGYAEVILERPTLAAQSIASAQVAMNQTGDEYVVAIEFTPESGRTFCRLTRTHTGGRFAILLDGRVLTAPRINEEICGDHAQISGNFTAQTAYELATLLNAGGLPAPVRLIEIRQPNSSIAASSVRSD